jgi:TetR/AcrR family transcriptional repressor of nem operon
LARPRAFDPKDVLDEAINLFWEQGYLASSVDEVVRRSGVAKYGVYGEFGSKRELFKKALDQYAKDRHRDIQAPIRSPSASLPEIKKFFENAVIMMTKDNLRRGCLVVNTGIEMGMRDQEFKDFVDAFFDETTTVMEKCLDNAIERKQVRKFDDVTAVASYLVTEFRAALMLAASGTSKQRINKHIHVALHILD